jgi:hypothetical protein
MGTKESPRKLWPAVVCLAAVVIAVVVWSEGTTPGEPLVPPGRVVSEIGLWKGTAETSINGKRLKAELRVEPGASSNDSPQAVLINTGEVPFGYGYGFRLDRLSDGFWQPVRDRSVHQAVLLHLSPGNRSEPEILRVSRNYTDPPHLLRPGEYRVTKDFEIDSGDKPKVFEVSARFTVD